MLKLLFSWICMVQVCQDLVKRFAIKKTLFLLVCISFVIPVAGMDDIFIDFSLGKFDKVKTLTNETNINKTDSNGDTLLINAIQTKNLEMVKFFLEKGADKNISDLKKRTPLELAIKSGNLDIVKQLFTPKNVNKKFKNTNTPLIQAAVEGKLDLVTFFLNEGANPLLTNNSVKTARDYLRSWYQLKNDDEKKLYRAAMDLLKGEEEKKEKEKLFLGAVHSKNIDEIKKFIGEVDINVLDENGDSALMIAVQEGALDIVKFLVEQGANSFLAGKNGFSPVELAIVDGNLEIIKLLITSANVNKEFYGQMDPLMRAIQSNKPDIIKFLVEQGANINKSYTDSTTPLMWVVASGDVAMVKLFLEKGANVSPKDGSGKNAREGAIELLKRSDDTGKAKFQEIINLLATKEKEVEQPLLAALQKLTEKLQVLEIKIKST